MIKVKKLKDEEISGKEEILKVRVCDIKNNFFSKDFNHFLPY